ncbi:MAG: glycosyltransferase [Planctomycetota bacterium]
MPVRVVVLSRGEVTSTPTGHQVQGFRMFADELRDRLGLAVELRHIDTLAEIRAGLASAFAPDAGVDAVMVMPNWSETAADVASLFAEFAAREPRPKLIMLDYYAPTCSPHFGVLPHVDLYIKRQVLRDTEAYQREYDGGFVYADFVQNTLGFDLDGWHFGSTPDPAHLNKLVSGWNLGVCFRNRSLLRLSDRASVPWRLRPYAVNRRVGLTNAAKKEQWYQFSRRKLLEAIEPLASKRRMTGIGRVGAKRYFAEMALAKLTLSPFGWGEVCFRDYEAIACGSLLVKPDMSHLVTSPDIYVPHETYVPIPWDFEGAAEICDRYLSDPRESTRIVRNARAVLRDYFEKGGFFRDVEQTLGRVVTLRGST